MGEAVVFLAVKDWPSSLAMAHCRICHETELESSKTLEAPCACSGTVKFAHRDCVQKWCDEKGNTVCEICLQKYEPRYRVLPPKQSQLIDEEEVTIRDGLEVPRREHDLESQELEDVEAIETIYFQCNSFAVKRAFRTLALILTVILLVRHLFDLFNGEDSQKYPFTFVTLLVVKVSGIVIPMYMLIRTITAIHRSIQKSTRHRYNDLDNSSLNSDEEEEDSDRRLHNI